MGAATGSSPPTAESSRSATRGFTAPWAVNGSALLLWVWPATTARAATGLWAAMAGSLAVVHRSMGRADLRQVDRLATEDTDPHSAAEAVCAVDLPRPGD